MNVKIVRAVACIGTVALLAGCGGSGSSNLPTHPVSQPPGYGTQTTGVTFSIVVPSKTSALRPAYISPSTQSVSITVTPSGGSVGTPVMVNCTSVCSGTIAAPVGNDTFAVKLYSGQNAAGNLLSTGSLAQTIVANQANSVNVTFNGVVASLAVSIPTITPGTQGSAVVTVNAIDASGNTIVGPGRYVDANGNPLTIALSDSDTSGNSSFSQTNVTQPTNSITLNYTAAFDANPIITASASGLTSASATVHFSAPTLAKLSTWSTTAGATLTETLSGTNFVAGQTTVAAGSGVTVSSVNVTSSTTLTATFAASAGAAFGTQNVSVTTSNGTSGTQPFSVATGSTLSVTVFTDTNAGVPVGTGSGSAGDLRSAILAANAAPGSLITFSGCTPSAPCTIALNGPLPPIAANTIIDGGAYGSVTVSGQNLYRAFWVSSGAVTLANLQIANVSAIGGNGGSGGSNDGGGGGAGLGSGVFVYGGNASLINDYFSNNAARGGVGGGPGTGPGGWGDPGAGGGGGLGGNGGNEDLSSGGGGGLLSNGQLGSSSSGGNGGDGFSGGGGSGSATGNGAPGGLGGGGGGAFYTRGPSAGGAGGFGGGGGGGETVGGTGGFGGGGGGVDFGAGSTGGAGGGGSGSSVYSSAPAGTGGALSAMLSGGSGDTNGYGGGGAAAGPAVFVYAGTVTTLNSGSTGCSATPGNAGGGSATNGGADATPVFNYGGTVNGATVTAGAGGPVATALGTSVP